jgi:hypothetical protein
LSLGSFTDEMRCSTALPSLLIRHMLTPAMGSDRAAPRSQLVVRRTVYTVLLLLLLLLLLVLLLLLALPSVLLLGEPCRSQQWQCSSHYAATTVGRCSPHVPCDIRP